MQLDQIKTQSSLPYSLYHSQQISACEGKAALLSGITLYGLMQRAGQASFDVLKMHFPDAKRVLVFTGKGNNGGDGYIFASLAFQAGLSVQLCQIGDSSELTSGAASARDNWLNGNGLIEGIEKADFKAADVIVDALFGTGLSREVSADYKTLIDTINATPIPVMSMDIPSGLGADCGTVHGTAIHAQVTVCFVGLKQGLFTGQAIDYCGQIYFSGLGVDRQFKELAVCDVKRVSYHKLSQLLPPRQGDCHKGEFGRVLVVGGNLGMSGAIRLAGEAALRAGTGLVRVLTRQENLMVINIARPELMATTIEKETADSITFSDWPSHLVIGPGLGSDEWAEQLVECLINSEIPSVVDADALSLLVNRNVYKNNWILTPHPGEAAQLLGCSVADISVDRFDAVRKIQKKFGGIVILKGAGSLICDDQQVYVANVGNPGMASGGMGDVLSGIIGALLAQGLSPLTAAQLAVCIHGEAGNLAAQNEQRGLLASDLFPYIKKLVNPKCVDYLQKNYKMPNKPLNLVDD